MPFWYTSILYLHILSVVISIGPYFVLIPLLRKIKDDEPVALREHLADFRFVVRISKHAGHVLVVSGVLLWWLGRFPMTTSWLVIPIVILLSALFFLARAFSPTLRALEAGTIDREMAVARLKRALVAYIAILLVAMWFMVAKPKLW